jgi:hypothetical protein
MSNTLSQSAQSLPAKVVAQIKRGVPVKTAIQSASTAKGAVKTRVKV